MNKKIYVIERQYIYSMDERSLVDELYEFDNLTQAVEKLNDLAIDYLNDKNAAIEVVEYEVNEFNGFKGYEYIGVEAGLYGVNAANSLGLNIDYMKTNSSTRKLLTRDENDEIYQIDLNLLS